MSYEHTVSSDWLPEAPLEDLAIGQLFGVASRLVGVHWWRMVEQTGLSVTGMWVLMTLSKEDGLTSREVAERTWCRPATLTGVADTLEREAYIDRRRDGADRRIVRLYLTEAGRVRLGEVMSQVSGEMRNLFDYVYPSEAPVIRGFLLATIQRFESLVRTGETDTSA